MSGYVLAFIGMLAVELPRTLSARAFGEIVKTHVPAGWTKTRDGDPRIAGHDAFYQYVTQGEL